MDLNLAKQITLRCGLTLPNRLWKAAMTEDFADKDRLPGSDACLATYRVWANGGWGLIMTGKDLITPFASTKRIKFISSIEIRLD